MEARGGFEVYPRRPESAARSGKYVWRLRAPNGKIIAVSPIGFATSQDAESACTEVAERMGHVEWIGPEAKAVRVELLYS
jgi:uncharacterized protein YegP (UPF0339 family)